MPESVRIYDFAFHDIAIVDIIKLELFCAAKVLENIAVFVCYCDSHVIFLLRKIDIDFVFFTLLSEFALTDLLVTIQ